MILIKIVALLCFMLLVGMVFLPQDILSFENLRKYGVSLPSMPEDSDSYRN